RGLLRDCPEPRPACPHGRAAGLWPGVALGAGGRVRAGLARPTRLPRNRVRTNPRRAARPLPPTGRPLATRRGDRRSAWRLRRPSRADRRRNTPPGSTGTRTARLIPAQHTDPPLASRRAPPAAELPPTKLADSRSGLRARFAGSWSGAVVGVLARFRG